MSKTATVPSYKNSKGKVYYFHTKGKLNFFAGYAEPKNGSSGAIEVPAHLKVMENGRTGMLLAKRIDSK